jgi:hypothetical protein
MNSGFRFYILQYLKKRRVKGGSNCCEVVVIINDINGTRLLVFKSTLLQYMIQRRDGG